MFHDVAVNIGIQLAFMLLINSREAAMSAEDNMINKMGITHDGAKVHRILQLHNTRQAVGSPPATFIRIAVPVVPAATLATLVSHAGTTGYSEGRLSGVFTPHLSLLTSNSSLKKNAAGAFLPRRTLFSDGVGDYSWLLSHHTGMVQASS